MMERMSDMRDVNGTAHPSLEAIVETFEDAWNAGDAPEIEGYLPDADHPNYDAIVCELLCVDFEHHWRSGIAMSIEEYQQRHPRLVEKRAVFEQLVFEDYRLRLQRGEPVLPADYAKTYGVTTAAWPRLPVSESETNAAVGEGSTVEPPGPAADRLDRAVQLLPDVGSQIHRFKLVEELDRGKFGRVFLARQRDLANRLVVLKLSTDLWSESDRLARLQHTNIVPVYSVHQEGDYQAVCMPFLGRHTLRDFLAARPASGSDFVKFLTRGGSPVDPRGAPPSAAWETSRNKLCKLSHPQLCLRIASRVASGLAHAHERGMLHQDVKPANILLTDEGEPMILDFNLSQDIVPGGKTSELIGGTLPYMAPEHLEAVDSGRRLDARSDIYSLGVILFQMLTGRLPFPVRDGTFSESLWLMIQDRQTVPPARALGPGVSPATAAIVRRCLQPRLDERYPSASQLQEDLERQLADLPLKHTAEPSLLEQAGKWRRRHPWFQSTAFLALAASVVIAITTTLGILRGRQLDRMRANERFHDFRSYAQQARAPLGLPTTDAQTHQAALKAARRAIPLYEPSNADWRQEQNYKLLDTARQQEVRDLLSELYYLLSASAENDAKRLSGRERTERLEEALNYNQLAAATRDNGQVPRAMAYQRGELLDQLGRSTEARRQMSAVQNISSTDPFDRYLVAAHFARAGKGDQAAPILETLASEMPQNVFVWLLLGNSYEMQGRLEDAEECFTICRALTPDSSMSYFKRGITRLHQKKYAGAEKDFDEVLEREPEHAAALLNRALARQGQGKLKEAIEDLSRTLHSGFYRSRAYLLRSKIWHRLGDQTKSAEDRQEALKYEPETPEGWISRGLARLPGDADGALADLRHAERLRPKWRRAWQNLAYVLAEQKDQPRQAIAVLEQMISENPTDHEAIVARGVLRARLGQTERAVNDAEAALQLDQSPQTLYQAACVFALLSQENKGFGSRAVRFLRRACQGDLTWARRAPGDPDLEQLADNPSFRELLNAVDTLNGRSAKRR